MGTGELLDQPDTTPSSNTNDKTLSEGKTNVCLCKSRTFSLLQCETETSKCFKC